MIKKVGLVLLALIAIVLGLAATKPDTFSVRRSITINAPAEKVQPLIADFRNWPVWSPWERLDPDMRRTFSGAPSGVGAVYAWDGNSDVGAGRMEIVDMAAPNRIDIRLDFLRPMETGSNTRFSLEPRGSGTEVTWYMTGPMPFISKVMSVFVSMDSMIGADFEKGLSQLKSAAEK